MVYFRTNISQNDISPALITSLPKKNITLYFVLKFLQEFYYIRMINTHLKYRLHFIFKNKHFLYSTNCMLCLQCYFFECMNMNSLWEYETLVCVVCKIVPIKTDENRHSEKKTKKSFFKWFVFCQYNFFLFYWNMFFMQIFAVSLWKCY